MANMLSIYKEVHDSRSNSGFSFSDITANQIGTRIGELATEIRIQHYNFNVSLQK